MKKIIFANTLFGIAMGMLWISYSLLMDIPLIGNFIEYGFLILFVIFGLLSGAITKVFLMLANDRSTGKKIMFTLQYIIVGGLFYIGFLIYCTEYWCIDIMLSTLKIIARLFWWSIIPYFIGIIIMPNKR